MNLLICGLFDGTNLWLQWDPPPDGTPVEVQTRYAAAEGAAWGHWIKNGTLSKCWLVVKAWKEGWIAQARVRPSIPGQGQEGGWQTAQEVKFLRSQCEFAIISQFRPLYFPPDASGVSALFVAVVDGAACAYGMRGELQVEPGEEKKLLLEARLESGWSQLDYENHFDLRPSLGVRVRNTGPSVNDVEPTGRDFTRLEKAPAQSLVLAFGGNRFNGG